MDWDHPAAADPEQKSILLVARFWGCSVQRMLLELPLTSHLGKWESRMEN